MSLQLNTGISHVSGHRMMGPWLSPTNMRRDFAPSGPIQISPEGIGGCVNMFGVEVCGEIPFGPTAPAPVAPMPPSGGQQLPFDPVTNGNGAGPCPDGYIRVGDTCIDPRAAAPGGRPLTVPASNGAVPKVPASYMATPILWANQYAKPKGYRLNKSGYFRRDPLDGGGVTYVPPKAAYVKSRRRNPLNPKAASRAISRISSAKDAAKMLSRVTVRSKKCGKC